MREEWMEYYECLEQIRREGSVNMFGATPLLAQKANVDEKFAKEILINWMNNYSEIIEKIES